MKPTDPLLTVPPRPDGAVIPGDLVSGAGPVQPCPTSIEHPPTIPTGDIAARLVGDLVTGAPSKALPGSTRQI